MAGAYNEYETAALKAMNSGDMAGVDEAIANLHLFYQLSGKDDRQNQPLFTGLHLMYLLVKDRREEFHRLLCSVDDQQKEGSPFIKTPMQLEQYLSQARYNQVIVDEKSLPHKSFVVFVPILRDTIRCEIANNIELSHQRISLKEAAELLFFKSTAEAAQFGQKRNWTVASGDNGQEFRFNLQVQRKMSRAQTADDGDKKQVDTERIAKQFIVYAKELEKIV